ncbi:hypothetical protein [Frankia sp. AgB32]|nr:hypothetical protein [Frankia sp. AgB32]
MTGAGRRLIVTDQPRAHRPPDPMAGGGGGRLAGQADVGVT